MNAPTPCGIADGQIRVDSAPGRCLGFTGDLFSRDSYLWKDGDRVLVSFIVSKGPGRGHFHTLVKGIEALGLRVAVPTPLGQMQAILARWGFVPHMETDPDMGGVEVWERRS
jgi:hypothetical protein